MPAYTPIEVRQPTAPAGLQSALGAGVFSLEAEAVPALGTDLGPAAPNISGERWMGGYALVGRPCGHVITGDPTCGTATNDFSGDSHGGLEASVKGMPFYIEAGVECSAMRGSSDLSKWHDAAKAQLELCQWSAVAAELWAGTESQKHIDWPNRRLAGPGADVLDTDVTLTKAIAVLEEGFYGCTCGQPRLIHASPRALVHLARARLVERQGTRWYTALGTLVVSDDGYPGSGPAGEAQDDDTTWLYGTTAVYVGLSSQVFLPEPNWEGALRVRDNHVTVRAQKLAAASWLCCHSAVQVRYRVEV